jgi:hypothetical protein
VTWISRVRDILDVLKLTAHINLSNYYSAATRNIPSFTWNKAAVEDILNRIIDCLQERLNAQTGHSIENDAPKRMLRH